MSSSSRNTWALLLLGAVGVGAFVVYRKYTTAVAQVESIVEAPAFAKAIDLYMCPECLVEFFTILNSYGNSSSTELQPVYFNASSPVSVSNVTALTNVTDASVCDYPGFNIRPFCTAFNESSPVSVSNVTALPNVTALSNVTDASVFDYPGFNLRHFCTATGQFFSAYAGLFKSELFSILDSIGSRINPNISYHMASISESLPGLLSTADSTGSYFSRINPNLTYHMASISDYTPRLLGSVLAAFIVPIMKGTSWFIRRHCPIPSAAAAFSGVQVEDFFDAIEDPIFRLDGPKKDLLPNIVPQPSAAQVELFDQASRMDLGQFHLEGLLPSSVIPTYTAEPSYRAAFAAYLFNNEGLSPEQAMDIANQMGRLV